MEGDPIPSAARSLLIERIGSVAQLEALLLLHSATGSCDAAAVAAALRIDPRWAEQILEELAAARLCVISDDRGCKSYRFPADDKGLGAAVSELADAYAHRRVSVITLIFAKPPSPPNPLKSFADAFCLRPPPKEPPHG